MADVVGTLTIEMAANIAHLTEDFAAAKAEVGKSVGEIKGVVEEMRDHIQESMARIGESIKMVQEAFVAIGAAIAGGSALKEAIGESSKMTMEAVKLGRSLGITATQASVLNVAMEDAFVSTDTMQAANKALTKTLLNNEDAFKNLGVSTRDQNGNYRNSLDIMLDVNEKLLEFKEGTDRNIEGTKVYGKTWSEVSGVLLLNRELMEEAAKKANDLGLVVGQENVDATIRFRHAMIDVEDVIKAVMKTIGDALMPVLTQLGRWFSDIGPAAVVAIKGAIGGLVSVFHGLVLSAKLAADAVKGVWNMLNADLHSKSVGDAWHNMLDEMTADAEATQKKLTNLFSAPTPVTKKVGGETSDGKDRKDKTEKSKMSRYEDELVNQKLLYAEQHNLREMDRADEAAYWQKILDGGKASVEDRLAVIKKMQQDKLALYASVRKQLDAGAKEEIDAAAKVAEAQLGILSASIREQEKAGEMTCAQAIAAEAAAQDALLQLKINAIKEQMAQMHDVTTAEYIKLNAEIATLEVRRQADEIKAQGAVAAAHSETQKAQIEGNAKVAEAQLSTTSAAIKAAEQAGQITRAQALAAEQSVQDAILQIKINGVQAQMNAIRDKTSVEYIRLNAELATIDAKRQADAIKNQGEIAAANIAAAQKSIDAWQKALQPISTGFDKMITGMIQGTATWQKSLGNVLKSVEAEFVNSAVKMSTDWAAKELWKTMATAQQIAAREALEKGAATTSLASNAEMIIKQIGNAAASAFAGVTSFLAPSMGPAAPAVAAGVEGTVLAIAGNVMSASGGYDIPAGVNPMTQLHQNEMVLPAELANSVRNMTSGGGTGDVHFHVNAIDTQGVQQFFSKHGSTIMDTIQRQGRMFNFGNAGRPISS